MTQEQVSLISSITAVISSLAAIIAIVIAIIVEIRSHKRFSEQLKREEKLALANIKPLLDIYPSKFINHKAVTLHNYGVGTAIITSITFSKDAKSENASLVNLFNFPQRIVWANFWNFRQKVYYIQAGQDLVLLKLTEENLSNQGFDEKTIKSILSSCEEQMRGINIQITYSDILGNIQEKYNATL